MKPVMKKLIFIIFVAYLILFLTASIRAENNERVNKEVYSALEKEQEVPVVIKPEEDSGLIFRTNNAKEVRDIVNNESIKGSLIVAEVSREDITKLEMSKAVESVEYVPRFSALLQDSAGIVNATKTWSLQVNNINLTGIGETICIIDTGINFSHSDLLGKNKTCIIDCFDKNCIENCSVSDDSVSGHGTHVAGIIAASSGIIGIAPEAGLIGLKVLDSSGSTNPTTGTTDIAAAIDWCVQNRLPYNISVISLSLGTTKYDCFLC